MSFILKMLHIFDNKKNREYVSDAEQFLNNYDKANPKTSLSQRNEAAKHRNISNQKKRTI